MFVDWINAVQKVKEMQIPSLIYILHFMNLTKGQDRTNVLRCRRSSSVSSVCPAGCATCSALNGCLSCKPRLFFHLEQDGMRQRGTCLPSCPRGHYGLRSPHISTCTKCKADCASCFSENFCTHCHLGFFLFRGKCESSCPKGLVANTALRECTECPAGCEWCVRKNMCTRCREDMYILHGQCHLSCPRGFEPDVDHIQCIPQSESCYHCMHRTHKYITMAPLIHHSSDILIIFFPPIRVFLVICCLFQFTVKLGNGQFGVHVFGNRARGPPGGDRRHALELSSSPQVLMATPAQT